MSEANGQPETLLEAIRYFSDPDVATEYFTKLRWPDGPVCPRCGLVKDHYYIKPRRLWQCKGCKKQFSVKVGTVFEDSPIGMDKWLPAMWMLINSKNGKSSYELERDHGVQQRTAWFMLHRIRLAMQTGTFEKLSGEVEAEETYIGGKTRNMHKDKREEKIQGRGASGKAVVMGSYSVTGKPEQKSCRTSRRRTTPRSTWRGVAPNVASRGDFRFRRRF